MRVEVRSEQPQADRSTSPRAFWLKWIAAVAVGYVALRGLGPSAALVLLDRFWQPWVGAGAGLLGGLGAGFFDPRAARGRTVYPLILACMCLGAALSAWLGRATYDLALLFDTSLRSGTALILGIPYWIALVPYATGLSLGALLGAVVPPMWRRP
jgi:hypothetical protein